MHTIYYYLMFWGYQIYLLPFRLAHRILEVRGETERARDMACARALLWSNFLLSRTGSRITREGLENLPPDRACLLVSNHQGEFDIPLIVSCAPRPTGFVAKIELRKIPLMGFWMKAIGCLFLDRNDRRQALEVSKQTVERLQSGYNMVIFPEGTRSQSNDVAPFKKGSLNIAVRAGVPIVPVSIRNSCHMKRKNKIWIQKADVRILFYPPIDVSNLSAEEKDNLVDRVHGLIQQGARNPVRH